MAGSQLEGHSILIVEDELLVAMDIADAFESVGAVTTMATTLHRALILVESEDLKAAVVASWVQMTVHLCALGLTNDHCRS